MGMISTHHTKKISSVFLCLITNASYVRIAASSMVVDPFNHYSNHQIGKWISKELSARKCPSTGNVEMRAPIGSSTNRRQRMHSPKPKPSTSQIHHGMVFSSVAADLHHRKVQGVGHIKKPLCRRILLDPNFKENGIGDVFL